MVHADGAPVYAEPRRGARRRGVVARGTRLPVRDRVAGDGCSTGYWFVIGAGQYLCEAHAQQSAHAPGGRVYPAILGSRLLPFDYAFVASDGARTYLRPSDYFLDDYAEALGVGFGVIVTSEKTYRGVRFARTRRHGWIERELVRVARASEFRGIELERQTSSRGEASRGEASRGKASRGKASGRELGGRELSRIAWVKRAGAPIYERGRARVARRAGRREVVWVADERRGWASLDDGTRIRTRDLTRVRTVDALNVPAGRTWIDVDVSNQTLVAYRGGTPVFATLVSTGKKRRTHETPRGTFPIWIKLAFSTMDDLERDDVERNYSISHVPWVQYFEGSNGLHATFWHDQFGTRRSHGCVNLSPRDARYLFEFTEPRLPPGWTAVLPTEDEWATLVRVR